MGWSVRNEKKRCSTDRVASLGSLLYDNDMAWELGRWRHAATADHRCHIHWSSCAETIGGVRLQEMELTGKRVLRMLDKAGNGPTGRTRRRALCYRKA